MNSSNNNKELIVMEADEPLVAAGWCGSRSDSLSTDCDCCDWMGWTTDLGSVASEPRRAIELIN